jgi:hypothetical protein
MKSIIIITLTPLNLNSPLAHPKPIPPSSHLQVDNIIHIFVNKFSALSYINN